MADEEQQAVLDRARVAGVRAFLVPATRLDDIAPSIAISEREDDVWAAAGFHPHEAKDFDAAAEAAVRAALDHPRVIAVGEIGLDYHYEHSPRESQREVFMRHVAFARALDKPVIVHNRESTDDLLDLLSSQEAKGVRGVIHSFTEDSSVAKRFLDLGMYISFSGIVTFRSAESLREAARIVPLDAMLIETDSPYLAPVPKRGERNEPAYVIHTAELLGGLLGVDTDEIGRRTTENFRTLFRVDVANEA